jgi:hypothetical protein
MRRPFVLALAAALALPAAARAQFADAPTPQRFTISPFLGYAFTYTQKGTVHLTDTHGTNAADYQRQVGGGIMPGVSVEYRMPGRFGAAATVAYNKRGGETLATNYVDVPVLSSPGGSMWFARGSLTMQLYDNSDMQLHQSTAQVSVGPALVRDVPASASGRPAINAFAVSAAANAELPLPWKGFSFRAAVEDYVAFLSRADLSVQLGSDISANSGQAVAADLSGGATHLYAIRAGLSYRF